MKKYIFLFCILVINLSVPVLASTDTEVKVEPRSSYVFDSVSAVVKKTAYGGDCVLVDKGKGTLSISIQKYASASNSWITMAGPSSKSFSSTTVCAYSKNKTLTKGKWRCKTSVTATVGNHTDSRTVYSGTFTVN